MAHELPPGRGGQHCQPIPGFRHGWVGATLAGLAGWLLTDNGAYRGLVPVDPATSYRLLFVVLGLCGILGGVLCMRSPERGEEESQSSSRTSLLAGWRILRYDRPYRQFLAG